MANAVLTPQVAAAAFRRAARLLPNAMRAGVASALALYTVAARQAAPVGRHFYLNGTPYSRQKLRRSIDYRVAPAGTSLGFGSDLLGFAFAEAEYTPFVIHGVHPHTRTKVPGRYRFFWEKAGRVVFPHKVNYPGYPPNPFHMRAFSATEGGMRRELSKAAITGIRFGLFT